MNILLLTSEFTPATGGIGTYAREIATAASELGANVTVLAPDYAQATPDDQSFAFRTRRFSGGLHSMRDLPAKIMLTRQTIRIDDFDILHAADWPFFIPLALARGQTNARTILTLHGTEVNETQTFLKRLAISACNVFGGNTEIAANSNFTRELFQKHFSVEPQRVNAIPLGVSEFWFGDRASRTETRQRLEIPPENIVMTTVARLTRRKGHSLTAAALASLEGQLPHPVTWLIVGPEGEADYVEELRQQLGRMACDIRLLGRQSDADIRDLYGASDFFCLTGIPDSSGRVEGFGLVYLEAAAANLPSVATRIGGVPDAVLADRTGLLVEPSVQAVANAIRAMVTTPQLRQQFATAALDHARRLSWRQCAARTYTLPFN
ncbi:glycosyl transferase [Afipia sp. P52-10]|jgi:glycosyltransferase involved in cell wall biosynthesis|uniref:glycosyltransferase family 4 protein n=1 Tax=Afipia sp. P52-10 TaxID=1429916 RepID=UPI0003DF2AA1|nr:glycosyltransferase family 4 protein [Afipia sp. P52-10]ETR76726.1 glycosyl transferase [Afipia sp. P52-10]